MKSEKKIMKGNEIPDISHWCDRWCEKCAQTGLCPLYKNSASLTPEEILESLPDILESAKKMLQEMLGKKSVDSDLLQRSDFENEYDWKAHLIRNDGCIALTKKYRKMVRRWLNSLKNHNGMEIRMQDQMLTDSLDIIFWYEGMFEIKLERALISKNDEDEEHSNPYDSLGTAKLLLVSIERSINAWSYVYQKFQEDEDDILQILISLQKISKKIEQVFPEARAFIRPGLDEITTFL